MVLCVFVPHPCDDGQKSLSSDTSTWREFGRVFGEGVGDAGVLIACGCVLVLFSNKLPKSSN